MRGRRLIAFRIVKRRHAETAFDGSGTLRYGSRWTSAGLCGVYLVDSLSLGILELLVHLGQEELAGMEFVGFRVIIPDALIASFAAEALPEGWDAGHPSPDVAHRLKAIGDAFLRSSPKPALRHPSAIVPSQANVLLSPEHPKFSRLRIEAIGPVSLDHRLKA